MDWIEERSGRDALTAVGIACYKAARSNYKPQRITARWLRSWRQLSPLILTICRGDLVDRGVSSPIS